MARPYIGILVEILTEYPQYNYKVETSLVAMTLLETVGGCVKDNVLTKRRIHKGFLLEYNKQLKHVILPILSCAITYLMS